MYRLNVKSNFRDINFWIIIIIFLVTVNLSTAIYLGRLNLNFTIFSIRFPHLLGIIGASFVSIFTPIFYILKRRNIKLYKQLLRLHMFGNVISLLMISMHETFRFVRLPLGLGFTLYILLLLLVLSGFSFKFNLLKPFRLYIKNVPHYNRFFHVSLTISFYLVFIIHLINVLGYV